MIVGTRTVPAYAEMSRILPTVDLSLDDDLLAPVRGNVEMLGRIFGKSEEAAEMVAALDNPLMARTRAVENGRVIYLDPHAAYIALDGYTALHRLLDQLTQALAATS